MSSRLGDEIRRVLDQEAEAIRSIPVSTQYDEVVELIYERIHQKGGKIIASGMGKAGHVANHQFDTALPGHGRKSQRFGESTGLVELDIDHVGKAFSSDAEGISQCHETFIRHDRNGGPLG